MAKKKKTEERGEVDITLPALTVDTDKPSRQLTAKELTPEENMLVVKHSVDALLYPSVNLYDEEAVMQRIRIYIQSCNRNGLRPTPPGMANWLGVRLEEMRDWMVESGTAEHRKLAARLYELLRSSWADYALTGKTPASVAIFVAKNWFAMSDANKVADAPQVQKQLDLEKLAAEAAALPDTDIIDADYKE